jgi:hypothetical protein
MHCFAEEPLGPNEWLHSLDEVTGKVVLSRQHKPNLNRYSFLWRGHRRDAAGQLSQLFQALNGQLADRATCVSAWTDRLAEIDLTIRSKRLASIKRKQGWTVLETEGLSVATLPAEELSRTPCEFLDPSSPFEGYILTYGSNLAPELFTELPARPTMEMLAVWRKLAPSERFLSWLEDRQLSVAYRLDDESGRTSAILISPRRLDLAGLSSIGVIQEPSAGKPESQV